MWCYIELHSKVALEIRSVNITLLIVKKNNRGGLKVVKYSEKLLRNSLEGIIEYKN